MTAKQTRAGQLAATLFALQFRLELAAKRSNNDFAAANDDDDDKDEDEDEERFELRTSLMSGRRCSI